MGPEFVNLINVLRPEDRQFIGGRLHEFAIILLESVQRPLTTPFDFARKKLFPLALSVHISQFSPIPLKSSAERPEVGPLELDCRGDDRKFAVKVDSDAIGKQVQHLR
jgi:hypothetical protein